MLDRSNLLARRSRIRKAFAAVSLKKIQHTIRNGAKGARILHKIQYSRSGACRVLVGLHNGLARMVTGKRGTERNRWRLRTIALTQSPGTEPSERNFRCERPQRANAPSFQAERQRGSLACREGPNEDGSEAIPNAAVKPKGATGRLAVQSCCIILEREREGKRI